MCSDWHRMVRPAAGRHRSHVCRAVSAVAIKGSYSSQRCYLTTIELSQLRHLRQEQGRRALPNSANGSQFGCFSQQFRRWIYFLMSRSSCSICFLTWLPSHIWMWRLEMARPVLPLGLAGLVALVTVQVYFTRPRAAADQTNRRS